jgi:hypothetical protein
MDTPKIGIGIGIGIAIEFLFRPWAAQGPCSIAVPHFKIGIGNESFVYAGLKYADKIEKHRRQGGSRVSFELQRHCVA